jgi:hypothetical protein
MRYLIVSLPVLALACGGAVGPIDPASLHIEGSYDFTTSTYDVDSSNSCCIQPNSGHPILSQHARLDIKKNGTSFEAVLTPDFGDPQVMTVTLAQDGTVTLAGGSVNFSGGGSSYQSVSDSLDTIVLAVGSDGHLAGTYKGTGQENVFEGDVGWMGNATATGNVGHDARAPQAQASAIVSATSVVLPWDALYARISEPVDSKTLASAIALSPTNGTANVSWELGPTSIDWLGGVSMTGHRTSWSDFSGSATFSVAGGLVDPSGNASSAVSTPLTFLDVPKAAAFSGATPPAMWGATQVASGTESCGTASSCIEIGPLDGPCTAQAGGLAARLDATSAKTISVVYRMRIASQYGQPYFGGTGFSLATPGKAAQSASDPTLTVQFNQTTDATYNYATDWVTANLAAPAQGEVGLALNPFGNASMYCGGGPAMPPVKLIVDVASISVK